MLKCDIIMHGGSRAMLKGDNIMHCGSRAMLKGDLVMHGGSRLLRQRFDMLHQCCPLDSWIGVKLELHLISAARCRLHTP